MQLRMNPDGTGVLTQAVDADEDAAMEIETETVDDAQEQQVGAPAPFEARTVDSQRSRRSASSPTWACASPAS